MDDADRVNERLAEAQEWADSASRARWARMLAAPVVFSRACVECGSDIGAARLAAMPTARLCIDCQGDLERRP